MLTLSRLHLNRSHVFGCPAAAARCSLLRLLLLWLPGCCCGRCPVAAASVVTSEVVTSMWRVSVGALALRLVVHALGGGEAIAVRALAACRLCCCDRLATSESSSVRVVLVGSLALSVGGASSKSVASLMLARACAAFSRAVLCAALRVSPRRPPRRRVRFLCAVSAPTGLPVGPQQCHRLRIPCAAAERESRTRPGGIPPFLLALGGLSEPSSAR